MNVGSTPAAIGPTLKERDAHLHHTELQSLEQQHVVGGFKLSRLIPIYFLADVRDFQCGHNGQLHYLERVALLYSDAL